MPQRPYEGTYMAARPRRSMMLVAIGLLALIGVLAYAIGRSGGYQERSRDAATGTSGRVGNLPDNNAPSQVPAEAVLNELETITGAIDGHELVGRRVDLRAQIGEAAGNANARGRFWIGPADSPLLVVLARDNRDQMQRIEGDPSANTIDPVRAGQAVIITGQIERLPNAEQRYSWSLTREELRLLTERPIYIRAESVTAVPQG